jgi:ParB family chromosome partitioning protein
MADNEYAQIPIEKITGWMPQERQNFSSESMAELFQSITNFGVLEPIGVVRDGDFYKGLWGQRRFLTAKAVGLKKIPALIQAVLRTEDQAIELRLTENIQRESLNPIELATGLDSWMKASGKTASEVAQRLGISVSTVSRAVRLLTKLPPAIQQQVARGEISGAVAYELSQVSDPVRQAELAAQATSGNLTRERTTRMRKASQTKEGEQTVGAPSRVTVKVTGGRSITVSAANLNLNSFILILEETLSRAREANKRKLTLSTFCKMQLDQSKGEN